MAHRRQLIRKAIQAALLAADTSADTRVYTTRKVPYKRLELPSIAIYSLKEPVDPDSKNTAPRVLTRDLAVAIEAVVKEGENVDDAMDDIALEIEQAMHIDPTFGDVCCDSLLSDTELELAEVGDQPVGRVTLLYTVTYMTGAPEAEDTDLDDFASAGVTYPQREAADDWIALHAYATVGERARNGLGLYEVITAGVSAASGGPTGSGTDITDGTVHWSAVIEAVDEVDIPTE